MTYRSSVIASNQTDIHHDLETIVKKHLAKTYQKPFHEFSYPIFEKLNQYQSELNKPIILDSGCGTGESSMRLARDFPNHCIIGIDQSAKRLERYIKQDNIFHSENLLLVRADVVDIWRMAIQANWRIKKHFILYPNPWPKKNQIKRRWHGHPVFPEMIKLCEDIELRTNWKIYADEFRFAVELIIDTKAAIERIDLTEFVSPFEKKYFDSGHALYKLYFKL
ncbi:MAG: methyltransferase domain-containing protein [Pseudomonadota bacterium]